jgi:hypothetical protein
MEIKQIGKGHSLSGECRRNAGLGHEKKASDGTHILEGTEGGISQDIERKRASKGYSRTGEYRGRG